MAGKPAARMTDETLHDNPHCHAPMHPNVPVAHPMQPHKIVLNCAPTVMINNLMAATVSSMTVPCHLAPCMLAGPGTVAMGSTTVIICGKPAARLGDLVNFSTCIAPIPSPTGKILPPCSANVKIG